jgi:hypothetical protein
MLNDFGPYSAKYCCFTVMNICADRKKIIKVFNYPIMWGKSRNLLLIPGVSVHDIRASLLKGELRHKLLAKDITITCSDIDLLSFNEEEKEFLYSNGVVKGVEVFATIGVLPFLFKQNVHLIGAIDSNNRIFSTPDKFLNGSFHLNTFKIEIHHNGRQLIESVDYLVSESGGVGTGYDTIILISFAPRINSQLYANYMIKNPLI